MRTCYELAVLSAVLVLLALTAPTANAQFRHGGGMMMPGMMPNMGMPNMMMPHMGMSNMGTPRMMPNMMSNTMMPNMMRSGSFASPRVGYGMTPYSHAMRPYMPYSYGMMPYSYGSPSRSNYSSANHPSASANYSSANNTVAGLFPTTNAVRSGYVVPFNRTPPTPVPFSYASGITQNGSSP